jgi:DNA polymerase I-like protein with 3'-5' exonuclease and polymerase domains/5'-3' exonuclease
MKVLLDLRGLVLHSYHSGNDPDGYKNGNNKIHTPAHTLETFWNNYLKPTLADHRIADVIAVLDRPSAFRKKVFPEYKAHRKDVDPLMKEAMDKSQEAVQELLTSLGILQVHCDQVEADDIIAYLCKSLPGKKLLHTVDNDLLQVSEFNTLVLVKGEAKNAYVDKTIPETPIPFKHLALYKALCGDSSDGYGGVRGFGPKKFEALVQTYGWDGIEEIEALLQSGDYNKLNEHAEINNCPLLSLMMAGKAELETCWQLAKLYPELVEGRDGRRFNRLQKYKRVPSKARLQALLESCHLTAIADQFDPYLPVQLLIDNDPRFDVKADVEMFKQLMQETGLVSFDIETWAPENQNFQQAANGREYVDMLSSRVTGAGFTFGKNWEHTIYLTFEHAESRNLSKDILLDILATPGLTFIIQNAYFERSVLAAEFGIKLDNFYDTKVMASYVDENESSGLKDCSGRYLRYDQIKYRDVVPAGKTMADIPAEQVLQYGADDPLVTAHLYELYRLTMELEGTWEFCKAHEFAAIVPLSEAYLAGVTVDWQELRRQTVEDREVYDASLRKLRRLIEENQTSETIQAGTQRLLEERLPVATAKARLKLAEELTSADPLVVQRAEDALEQVRVDTALETKLDVTYERPTESFRKITWKPTPTGVAKILEKYGLPELPKGTKDKLRGDMMLYLQEHRDAHPDLEVILPALVEAQRFIGLPAKQRDEEPKVQALVEVVEQILTDEIPPERRKVVSGTELNLDSPKQMQALLYGMLDLPVRMRAFEVSDTNKALGITTPAAQVNEDAIRAALAEDAKEGTWKREALESLLAAKKAATRLKMFYVSYPLWEHPLDGQVHPQINSCGTETRRPSGSSPNLLQLPKRGEGLKFRKCLMPNKKMGHDLIVSIDWSQQELRVAGALSMDKALLDCYIGHDVEHAISAQVREMLGQSLMDFFLKTESKDVHTQTGAGILGISYEATKAAVNDPENPLHKKAKAARTSAKSVNFGGAYGIGPSKLSRQLLCPLDDAKDFLAAKKTLYSSFEEWREDVIQTARMRGYVTTAYGNRRHVHGEIHHNDEGMRGHVERQVVNYLIQGVCADNLKVVLAEVERRQILQRHNAVLVAPIYDELVVSCHSSQVASLILELHEVMTRDIPGLAVPMLAEPSLGVNFADQEEIGPFPTLELIEKAVGKVLQRGRPMTEEERYSLAA